jgi:hypothetical protein
MKNPGETILFVARDDGPKRPRRQDWFARQGPDLRIRIMAEIAAFMV